MCIMAEHEIAIVSNLAVKHRSLLPRYRHIAFPSSQKPTDEIVYAFSLAETTWIMPWILFAEGNFLRELLGKRFQQFHRQFQIVDSSSMMWYQGDVVCANGRGIHEGKRGIEHGHQIEPIVGKAALSM